MSEQKIRLASLKARHPEHVPVLLEQSLDMLNLRAGLTYVDATAGAGGHLQAIIETLDKLAKSEEEQSLTAASIIGIDRDLKTINQLQATIGDRISLIHGNFGELKAICQALAIATISGGILADLGMSSPQVDDATRGFSFQKDGPLDMRMDQSQALTAAEIVNHWPEADLAKIIFDYGEERYSRAIARQIVKERPIQSTLQLADLVTRTSKRVTTHRTGNAKMKRKRSSFHFVDHSHPATRTFQALRIAVNDEFANLKKFLQEAISLLSPGGRIAVITFHSLEDRMVKQIFRQASLSCICPPRQPQCTCDKKSELLIITKKPIVASAEEVLANTRSRSAKLRAVEKLG